MKVLDKVYIHLTPHLGLLEATAIPVNAPDEQKYIRKDALLEWLEQEEEQHLQWMKRYGSMEDSAIVKSLRKVIDKLNSM